MRRGTFESRAHRASTGNWSDVCIGCMADRRRRGNRRRRTRRHCGPDRIHSGTGNNNWNVARDNNTRINADSGDNSAWNSKPDPRDRESNPRDGDTCTGHNA